MGTAGRVLRQLLVAALLAAFVVACLRLGWWQLQRYESPGGSLQNLGYTLQWPTFAIFAVIMWWRLRRLERTRRETHPAQHPAPASHHPPAPASHHPPVPATHQPPAATHQSFAASRQPAGAGPAAPAVDATPAARPNPAADKSGEPGEPDDELAAYNRYLAQLNAAAAQKEHHRGR